MPPSRKHENLKVKMIFFSLKILNVGEGGR
jgi:hypothetical protein